MMPQGHAREGRGRQDCGEGAHDGRQVRDVQGGGKTGGYRWRLNSRNGEIVASGEAYETKAGAKKGVAAVQRAAADAKVEDLTNDS